jgi:hypothetical protein
VKVSDLFPLPEGYKPLCEVCKKKFRNLDEAYMILHVPRLLGNSAAKEEDKSLRFYKDTGFMVFHKHCFVSIAGESYV